MTIILTVPVFGTQNEMTYIINGLVFDGNNLSRDMTIVIAGNKIHSVQRKELVTIPEKAKTIDAQGMSIIPGLIDTHIHLTSPPMPVLNELYKKGWGKLAEEAMSHVPENRRALLTDGVTTIMDMGAPLEDIQSIRRLEENNKIMGPEIIFSGPLFTAPLGHPAGTIYKGYHNLMEYGTVQVANPDIAKAKVNQLISCGVDFIKIVYDNGKMSAGKIIPRLDLQVAAEIITATHRLNRKVFAHIGAQEEEAKDMIDAGVDGIEHCFWASSDTILHEMAARKVFFTPTLSVIKNYMPNQLERMFKTVKTAYTYGVPITVGTDFPSSGGYPGADIFTELSLLEKAGIPRLDVLRSATAVSAAKLGKDTEIGYIKPGFKANLVLMKGDILSGELSPQRIEQVIFNGKILLDNTKKMNLDYAPYFEKKSYVISPYGWYAPSTSVNLGVNWNQYNIRQWSHDKPKFSL